MNHILIVSGGIGSRMQLGTLPKQYIEVGGRPIIAYCLEKFEKHPLADTITIVADPKWYDYLKELIRRENISKFRGFAPAGDTRQLSILNGLIALETDAARNDVVSIHDAVRPFLTQQMIDDNIAAVEQYGACGTCIPATDTIVVSEDGTAISEIPDRSRLHQMQTPQSFRPLKLKALMDSLTPDEEAVLTDGCKIYLLKGEPVAMVPGAVTNIKITYPSDLAFAEAFLKGEEDA